LAKTAIGSIPRLLRLAGPLDYIQPLVDQSCYTRLGRVPAPVYLQELTQS